MPVYEYACAGCTARPELLLPVARAADPGPCPGCGGTLSRRYGRVAARFAGWGFARTDGLVPDRPGRAPWREVAERAERIADTGTA